MRKLDNASLVIIDCRNYAQALFSLKRSLAKIEFEKVLFLTDIDLSQLPDNIEVKKIPSIRSKDQYSKFVIKNLASYIDTDYFLLIQWDSEILDGSLWNDDWYNYDYIAPTWPFETDGLSVGCGGFSWRSKRLHEILASDELILPTPPEDVTICRIYRRYLEEKYGMRWPSDEISDKFAYELKAPKEPAFGKHGFFHEPYSEIVVIQRDGAGGDCIMVEPVMHYFHKKGYRVALKTQPHFFNMFAYHYFKVYHPQELDGRIPVREIDLNMGYEVTPKRLHLESYYELCGIKDGEIRNPKLVLNFDPKNPNNKLFKKQYVTIHIDERLQPSRNIYGVDWIAVVDYLLSEGYEVLQIGNGDHEVIPNAVQFNAPNEIMLMSIIGGADIHVGIDSGPSNIAIAMNTKAVICFGSVNPAYIIPDMTNVVTIHNHETKICELPFCWSESIGCTGTPCYIDDTNPPCAQFSTKQIIDGIKTAICK